MEEQANITKYDKRLSGCSATCFGYNCTTFAGHLMPGLEPMISFDVLLTVQHLSIFILVINQLDAQNFVLQ